jgi:transposase
MGRPLPVLALEEVERAELQDLANRQEVPSALALRARIVLRSADGLSNQDVAEELGTNRSTVGKWRRRFIESGLEGLADSPRSGTPRRISDDEIKQVIARTLKELPEDASRWTTRSMAKATGFSRSSISRIWRALSLQPQHGDTSRSLIESSFGTKVHDIVGIYVDVGDQILVLSADAAAGLRRSSRSKRSLPVPMRLGPLQSQDHVETVTTGVFANLGTRTAAANGRRARRHRSLEILRFLRTIDESVPAGLDLHLVLPHGTEQARAIRGWLHCRPRFQVHVTPIRTSWVDFVAYWFAELNERQTYRHNGHSSQSLRQAMHDYLEAKDSGPRRLVWTVATESPLRSINKARSQA